MRRHAGTVVVRSRAGALADWQTRGDAPRKSGTIGNPGPQPTARGKLFRARKISGQMPTPIAMFYVCRMALRSQSTSAGGADRWVPSESLKPILAAKIAIDLC
jgi:hypothetical protein